MILYFHQLLVEWDLWHKIVLMLLILLILKKGSVSLFRGISNFMTVQFFHKLPVSSPNWAMTHANNKYDCIALQGLTNSFQTRFWIYFTKTISFLFSSSGKFARKKAYIAEDGSKPETYCTCQMGMLMLD